ncbi:MAG: Ig-like domain-containing protein [Bacteroidales bacterium]|jgi:hypothetical protein
MKTKILLTILAIVTVILIVGCKKDDFIEIKGLCPAVESANPANGVSGIPVNQGISVNFNQNMNPASFIQTSCNMEASFTLQGDTLVAGTVSYNGTTATFTPSVNLLPGTTYTATITGRVKNLEGIPLAKNYVWSFTTAEDAGGNVILSEDVDAKKTKI